MTEQSFDPLQYKAKQRHDWDAVAAGWKKWWQTLEQGAQRVSDRLVALAEIQSGQRILDVATGIGEPAVTAARKIGPTGWVVATDQAPQMLAVAQERAAGKGLQNIEFLEMDGEVLDLPEDGFDAILCRWGLMFFPERAKALARMARLLAPNGRLAAATWDIPPKVPMISLAMGVVQRELQLPPPPVKAPGPFSLADARALERQFTQAGFTDVHSERLTVPFEFPSVEDYVGFQQEVAAPVVTLLADHPPRRRAEIWTAIARAARQYATADGRIRFLNEAICIVGRRPR